jgi:hypothetical protein
MAKAGATVPSDASLIITIHVRDYAEVDAKILAQAKQVAAEIFKKAGVETHWIDVPEISQALSDLPDRDSPLSSDLHLHILSQRMSNRLALPDNVMGLAPGKGPDRRLVYVFYGYVTRLALRQARQTHATVGHILGEMIAHELGHILLNLPAHSEIGIMRGDWDLKDLCNVAYGLLFFTQQQAEVIRTEVVRRNSQQTSAVESANLAFEF